MVGASSRALAREAVTWICRALGIRARLAVDVDHSHEFMGLAPSRTFARHAERRMFYALGIRAPFLFADDTDDHINKFMGRTPSRTIAREAVTGVLRAGYFFRPACGIRAPGHFVAETSLVHHL